MNTKIQKRKLTKLAVDRASYQTEAAKLEGLSKSSNRVIVWDSELPNFGLRLYPTGNKSYILSYRNSSRQKRLMVLGSAKVLTPDMARKLAKEKLFSIQTGEDPLADKRKNLSSKTFKEFSAEYLTEYALKEKKSSAEDEQRLRMYLNPKFGKLQVKNITQAQVARLHRDIGKRSNFLANRCLSLLSKMFNLAIQWGVVERGWINPAKGVTKFKEKSRDRWVTEEELPRLAQAINEEPNLYVQAAILLYLFTGARKQELLQAKWSDINWTRNELRLGDTKAGEVQYVALPAPAIAILSKIPRIQDNHYILVGRKHGHHLVNISKPWKSIRVRADLEDVRLHDLRRTFGSWLAQSGASLHLIGKLLRHKDAKTTQVYARLTERDSREAVEGLGKIISKTLSLGGLQNVATD